jgi:uncharacterized protein (TIGR00369 family)
MTAGAGFRHDVARWVLRLPVAAHMGFTFQELAEGRAVSCLPWRRDHSHAPGAFQASPIAALADFTGAAACLSLLASGSAAVTVDYTAKFLSEARGSHLVARARVLRPGATLTVAAVDVYVASAEAEALCAAAFVTTRNFPAPARARPATPTGQSAT